MNKNKYFKNFEKPYKVLEIMAAIGSVFTLVSYAFTEDAQNFIISYPRLFMLIFIILFLWAVVATVYPRKRNTSVLQGLKPANNNQKRYSIVFVDDMFKKRATFTDYKDKLATYDILLLSEVTNIRLLAGFDIIILDIIGAGGALGDTKMLIEEMLNTYPYKYIIVYTSNTCGLESTIRNSCQIVQKPPITEDSVDARQALLRDAVESIQNGLRIAFEQLDNPEKNWTEIEKRIPKNEKDSIKKKFEHYVLDSGIYTQSAKE